MANTLIDRVIAAFTPLPQLGSMITQEQQIWVELATIRRVVPLLAAVRRYCLAAAALDAADVEPWTEAPWDATDEEIALRQEWHEAEVALLEAYNDAR